MLLMCCRLHTGVHAKYANMFRCHLVLSEKKINLLRKRFRKEAEAEDDRFKASIDCLSKPGLQKAKEKGRKNGWMKERKEVRMASGQAARKERALQFWIHSSVYLPLKENVHAGSKGKTGWANIPNSR